MGGAARLTRAGSNGRGAWLGCTTADLNTGSAMNLVHGGITMTILRPTRLLAFLLLVLVGGQPAFAQEAPLKGFDDYVNKGLKDWGVPGVAVAVVKDDRVVFAKGYGVRKLGDPAPVNEKTLFAIGS